jgi:hypothetical protein
MFDLNPCMPLPLAGRLMRVLRTVIEIVVLPVLHTREYHPLGRSVAAQLVGHDHSGNICQSLEQLAEKPLRGVLVAPPLHQDIQHVTVLVHGPPQIVLFAVNGQKNFIQAPFAPWLGTLASELVGVLLTRLATPLPDRFVRHDHATAEESLFDIPVVQTKSGDSCIDWLRLVCSCDEYATPGKTPTR